MTDWATFADASPEVAAAGRRLLERTGSGRGLLATVRGDAPPRINPVSIGFVDGHLLTFVIVDSAKDRDLLADGRYALHAQWDPAEPHEFLVRGQVRVVDEPGLRESAIAGWPFEVDDGYRLYELEPEQVLLGERASDDDWPPVYRSWRSAAGR